MSAYVVAQLAIHDRASYEAYARSVPETLEPFGGEVIVADDAPHVLDGSWGFDRLVLLRFPDHQAARWWAVSDSYRRIAVLRDEAASTTAVLVRGVHRRGRPAS